MINLNPRHSTGIPALDSHLGGGLIPGTLTVVVGASGIGKTQLGVSFANAGRQQEGARGVFFDMTSRGDSQSHAEYAERMFDWNLAQVDSGRHPELQGFFDRPRPGDYLHVFDHSGRRVHRRELDFDGLRDWKGELAAKLEASIGFLYGNFIHGVRRVVVDGIEPAQRASDSIQLELFEYVYHQIVRKEAEWVARDLFRQQYREHAERIAGHDYDSRQICCVLLLTSHESMLDPLIERPLEEGDVLANANTILYLGKIRDGSRLTRGLFIPKHRGSYCTDQIIPYTIDARGIQMS